MAEPAAAPRSKRVLALYGTAAAVLVLDQLLKHLVVTNLAGRPPLDLIGSCRPVPLHHQLRRGVLAADRGPAVLRGDGHRDHRRDRLRLPPRPAAVHAGRPRPDPRGALGNLADRLFRGEGLLRGEVVDFVKVGIWPVFNLADSCVVVGGILLAIFLGRAEREPEQAPADTDRT